MTVIIPNKTCPKCGGHKFYFKESKSYISKKTGENLHFSTFICGDCLNERVKMYYKNNPEYIKSYHKSQKGKDALNRARQKERDNLTDNYIRQNIYTNIYNTTGEKIVRKNITSEQIEIYRQTLIAKRKLKKVKNGKH